MEQPNDKNHENFTCEFFTSDLETNILVLKQRFDRDDTIVFRRFENLHRPKLTCYTVYLEAMVDNTAINDSVIRPMEKSHLPEGELTAETVQSVITCNGIIICEQVDEAVANLLRGDTLLLVSGLRQILALNTKGGQIRGVTEPDNEKNLLGPRDGFTETMMVNISLVRRRLQTSDLKLEMREIGTVSHTRVCVGYLDGIVDPEILKELNCRLDKIEIDAVLDSNYIDECIKDSRYSPFKTVGKSEKPDVVAAKLLEGRVAIFVDGSPIVLTVPYLFIENFQANDDYYINYYFSSLGRVLRVGGFFITIVLPSLYIALVNFHHEMIPGLLLLNIAKATTKVPLSAKLECALTLAIFEVLRETGVRMPSKAGQALSIVGALVLGQATVAAGIISYAVVIIVALSGITGLLTPRVKGASLASRIYCIILTSFLGLYGVFFGILTTFIHLLSMSSFGVFYLTGIGATTTQRTKDIMWRAPFWMMRERPPFARDSNLKRSSMQ